MAAEPPAVRRTGALCVSTRRVTHRHRACFRIVDNLHAGHISVIARVAHGGLGASLVGADVAFSVARPGVTSTL